MVLRIVGATVGQYARARRHLKRRSAFDERLSDGSDLPFVQIIRRAHQYGRQNHDLVLPPHLLDLSSEISRKRGVELTLDRRRGHNLGRQGPMNRFVAERVEVTSAVLALARGRMQIGAYVQRQAR